MRLSGLPRRIPKILKASQRYIILTAGLFLMGIAAGVSVFHYNPLDASQLLLMLDRKFGPMAQSMAELSIPGMAGLVFWNNLKATGLLVAGGVAFGILPMIMVFINGLIVGMVSGDVIRQGFGLFPFILVGILPHGLFEIPAYIIGGTLGIRLGFNILGYERKRQHGQGLKIIIVDTLVVLVVVLIPLLAIGALIEVSVTRQLVEWVMGDALRWH
ncbi:MAG: stage II sporulation protein M [Firmicutes bacterium]|nr:stage II sporulation protein M [Bacillota bacterium]